MDMRTTLYLTLLRFTTLSQENGEPGQVGCIVLVTFYNYFSVTNFFWMLVEGKGDDNYYWMGVDHLIMHCLAPPFRTCRPVLIHAGGGDLLWGQHSIQDLRGYRLG